VLRVTSISIGTRTSASTSISSGIGIGIGSSATVRTPNRANMFGHDCFACGDSGCIKLRERYLCPMICMEHMHFAFLIRGMIL
jgi:hypothetical protein